MVDDNCDAALSLALILAEHDVLVAHTGEEALVIAREFDPDAVLLDLGLPDMTGYDVAERLRNVHRTGRPVLAVSRRLLHNHSADPLKCRMTCLVGAVPSGCQAYARCPVHRQAVRVVCPRSKVTHRESSRLTQAA
ncbi:response regulator [Paraburkholderia strydomiana]|uniref:response regulator n=1 Tax=Paraburkholderia strydomiana TaxID=1245417 RepID=UPI001BE80670|nr:response regulator [Paraburkholderia strydomiana]